MTQYLWWATIKIPLPVGSLARGWAGPPRGTGAQSAIRTAEWTHPINIQSALASFTIQTTFTPSDEVGETWVKSEKIFSNQPNFTQFSPGTLTKSMPHKLASALQRVATVCEGWASGTYSLSECLGEVSSSSVSLLMVITLTAGLGESAMMMVCRCLSETEESCRTDASWQFRASPSEVWRLSCVSTQLTSSTSFPLIIFGEINAECGILVFCNELLLQPKK